MASSTAATSSASTGAINVVSIVSSLMAVASIPLNNLTTTVNKEQATISAYGTLQSQVTALQTAAAALGSSTSSSLMGYQTTSSNTGVLNATAGSTAVAGSYTLNITSLAQSQSLVATGQTSTTTAIGTGTPTTLTFDFGTISGGTLTSGTYSGATFTSNGSGTKSIVIDSTNNTLQGISNAINAAGLGVSATIVNDGSGTPYRLSITSSSTGISNSIKITATAGGDATVSSLLSYDPQGVQNLNQTVAAQNATFNVNGIAMTKTSNTITNAIQGVTLNLSQTTAVNAPVTLSVSRNTGAVSTAVTNFVNAYNTLYSSMQSASAYKSTSPLAGEATIRDFMNQMRSIAAGAVTPLTTGGPSSIEQAGISFTAAGVMQVNTATLNTAMTADYNGIANLFNNATTGYGTLFTNLTTTALSATGSLANRTASLTKQMTANNNQINILNTQLAALQVQYTKQYTNLNVVMAQMSQTSSYLTQQLSHL
jgi:flagellar hook-associated protein 2